MINPKVTKKTSQFKGKFLNFLELEYLDSKGVQRRWEAVDRTGHYGAIFIIAKIVPDNELILIRQFRPPTNRLMLEFPAGLIDPGETPDVAAHRELLEETGYYGTIINISKPAHSSPGMTGETISLVHMEISGDEFRKHPPVATPEESESIEVFRVPIDKLPEFVSEQEAMNVGIDSKIYTMLTTMNWK